MAAWSRSTQSGQSTCCRSRPSPHHAAGAPGRRRRCGRDLWRPAKTGNFIIGYTREQGHPVCIDLEKFVQRSSGIFGATGTGKSFLTRIILAGLIQYNKASVLVFDMHNEYGFDDTASDTNQRVVGLQNQISGAGARGRAGRGATIRGQRPISTWRSPKAISCPKDIEMLTRELNLKETTPTTLDALVPRFGERLVPRVQEHDAGRDGRR